MCDWLSGGELVFFHPVTNSIFIYESDSFENSTFLHETIHKATEPKYCKSLPSFFIEGGAESIIQKVYGRNELSKIDSHLQTKEGYKRTAKYNCWTDTRYINEMCLLK